MLSKSTWAVLALIYQIELFTQKHYMESIEPEANLCELYKDLFFFHWKEEVTHALMDELEWPIEDRKLTPSEREQAVTELIELISDIDGILQVQAAADVEYFLKIKFYLSHVTLLLSLLTGGVMNHWQLLPKSCLACLVWL